MDLLRELFVKKGSQHSADCPAGFLARQSPLVQCAVFDFFQSFAKDERIIVHDGLLSGSGYERWVQRDYQPNTGVSLDVTLSGLIWKDSGLLVRDVS